MNAKARRVFHLRYVDPVVTPGEWAYSGGMTIGYFSSEEKAREALEQVKDLPGFVEDVDGFFIEVFTIGVTRFPRGFDPSADIAVLDAWLSEDATPQTLPE